LNRGTGFADLSVLGNFQAHFEAGAAGTTHFEPGGVFF
jgi:hypothetical protein